jgi:hypothetical protein
LALSKLSKRFGLILRSAYFSPKIQKDLWLEPNPQPPCTGIRIFFSATLGIRIFFLEKNSYPPLQVKWSVPKVREHSTEENKPKTGIPVHGG